MANKRPKAEEIVSKLRQVEVLMGQGLSRLEAIRRIGVVEQTYYRWRKQYGGMGVDQLKELKRLQQENDRLRRAVSDLTLDKLTDLFILRGVPAFIRSDNGPEFIAQAVRDWISAVGAKTAYIEPGSPWENGYCESFNARFRDEMLNGEVFYSLHEAQILIEQWRKHYNTKRPHSALGYRTPAPETIVPMDQRPIMH